LISQIPKDIRKSVVICILCSKMSLERYAPSSPTCTEIEEVIFPKEIWIMIWSYIDFKTLQKICTRVSKSWLEMIRSSKLSWEMKLRDTFVGPDMLEVEDFNAMLSQWKELREIHFSSEQDFAKFRLSLNSKKSLKKVVILSRFGFDTKGPYVDHPLRGLVSIYWVDPKHLLTPADEIENVMQLQIDVKGIPEEFAMRQEDRDFTNLETLQICENNDEGLSSKNVGENVVPFLLRFKELKKLVIGLLEIHIDYLLDILRFLGNMKTLTISVTLAVIHELNEEATKDIFNKALEIVNKKFPFPDVRIVRELKIFENDGYLLGQPIYSIIYGECGAKLRHCIINDIEDIDDIDNVMSGSEYDTSDYESDTSDSEIDTSDSKSDTSDSMDESNGSSDFINNASVENSDSEDMNV
jgi:hypothetical protein